MIFDDNFVDYLIEKVLDDLHQFPGDYDSSHFNSNWVESFIYDYPIWDEEWTSLSQEQQSELMDYVVSCVSESLKN